MRGRVLLFAIMVLSMMAEANDTTSVQPEHFSHYIDFHATGGVSSLHYTLTGGEVLITPSFSVGAGYTCFFHRSVGLQVGIHLTRVATEARLMEPMEWKNQTDYMGDIYDHRMSFSDWRETQQSYLLEVPLGLRFRYHKDNRRAGLYAALGAKLAIPVFSNYATSGSVTHTAWYDQWQLELHDLPGRFETETFDSKKRTDIDRCFHKWNAEAYAEIGLNIRLNIRADLLIAVYGQYIFTNFSSIADDAGTPLGFATDHNNAYTYMATYDGLIGTDRIGSIHPWMAGLKLGFSIYPGFTREQRKRQLERLAGEFPDLMPMQHDTLIQYDTIRLHDTIRIERVVYHRDTIRTTNTTIERPTAEEKRLAALLSQAVIWFHFDKYEPILEPAYILDSVASMMKRYEDLRVNVNGHACVIGGDSYNQRLAMRRAKAVASLLESKGIAANRMNIVSYGASHPYRYNTKRQLARDRRVEVVPEGYELQPEDIKQTTINSHRMVKESDIIGQYTIFLGEERVRPGSRLAQIARRWYGEPEYWVYIWEANADKVANPQRLPQGLLLMIPDLQQTLHEGMNKQEALNHAKMRIKQYRNRKY